MPDIVHICYPGIGGQAAVATGLASEGQRGGISQGIVFYGVEPTAEQYLTLCDQQGIEYVSILKNPGIGLAARRALGKAVAEMNPRMVISHHHDTAISVAGAGLNTSNTEKIFVEHHSNALKTRKDWILSTLAHRLSDHTVYLTESYREEVVRKTGRWLASEKSSVIANGLDLVSYQPSKTQDSERSVIGMQGRMDTGKDFETLLRSFAKLPHSESVVLDLVGDGPDRAKLEKLAADLGVQNRVTFTGFLSQTHLIERMRAWDIAVLMTMGETLSMAILEAWALQLPLISTRAPGVAELVQQGSDGLLIETSNARSLADAIMKLIDDPKLAQQLGRNGRSRVEHDFDRKQNWLSYLKLCAQISPRAMSSPKLSPRKIS